MGTSDFLVRASVRSVLTFLTDKLFTLVHEKILSPVIKQARQIVNAVLSSLMQVLDGLCGLIPEFGGVVCSLVSVGASNFGSWLLSKLADKELADWIKTIRIKVEKRVLPWADRVTKRVMTAIQRKAASIGMGGTPFSPESLTTDLSSPSLPPDYTDRELFAPPLPLEYSGRDLGLSPPPLPDYPPAFLETGSTAEPGSPDLDLSSDADSADPAGCWEQEEMPA
uniref:Uncharacterized protein n=1 Tax=Chromera velia CCMP2878 TaxID=1169474 RepID=A0A0G4F5Z9_9ALVE|eukprot:Cvel_15280.t1-p1 / transcript=Cvel_15280.t1 / gene=Cvel_15280 / organism=Chromera_velia_CCMP2878 / gene_product=hypothetical protein / transcript_product=hypothetical protein / location=Cvel_scaffold1121:22974-23642(+) / protein_length=223 / sequence_SO=supercontig / SO=protein_coding / is_pseudo=false